MTDRDVRERLIGYLEEKVFHQVLTADPERAPAERREALREAQRLVRGERERLRSQRSAEALFDAFEAELASDRARQAYQRLRELDLPTLADVRLDFEQMAQDLGVGLSGPSAGP